MIDRLVLAILRLSVLHEGARTAQRGVARARPHRNLGKFSDNVNQNSSLKMSCLHVHTTAAWAPVVTDIHTG
jgi:hypothetical protein